MAFTITAGLHNGCINDHMLADAFTDLFGSGRGHDGKLEHLPRPTGAPCVGSADGDDVFVVSVGSDTWAPYWLAHIPDTDYNSGIGATPTEAVQALQSHLPRLTKWAINWDLLRDLAARV